MHTEGIIHVERQENASPGVYDLKIGAYYVALTPGGMPSHPEEANALRLAACWNALIGASTSELVHRMPGSVWTEMSKMRQALECIRSMDDADAMRLVAKEALQ